MKLENQVVSLELSKKLKELGVKQISFFYWNSNKNKVVASYHLGVAPIDFDIMGYYSAFTVAELGEMLPESVELGKGWLKIWSAKTQTGLWRVQLGEEYYEIAETEADARAKLLIHLLENNLIK
jgi:hypothetical protein